MKNIIYFLLALLLTVALASSSAFIYLYFEKDFSTLFLISIISSNIVLLFLGALLIIKLLKTRHFFSALIACLVVVFSIGFALKISNWDGSIVTGFYNIAGKEKVNDQYYLELYYLDLDTYLKFRVDEKEYNSVDVSDRKGYLLAFKYIKINGNIFSNLDHITTQTTDISSEEDI
ncbi:MULTISPECIES: hypothetical protein [Listeria]|uniref:hypothetical protein n=1 Tax=Listeria TaxID=1637 RepID=UPI000B594A69|nr:MULTISPECIES: hypothetical protein [Listeria]